MRILQTTQSSEVCQAIKKVRVWGREINNISHYYHIRTFTHTSLSAKIENLINFPPLLQTVAHRC